jgi:hypothetical protein
MVAIFVASAASEAANNNKNNYSGKLKRKTRNYQPTQNCIPNSFQDGETTPAQSSRAIAMSPRTHCIHAKVSLPG